MAAIGSLALGAVRGRPPREATVTGDGERRGARRTDCSGPPGGRGEVSADGSASGTITLDAASL
ncbi:hypothetical protein ABTZ70_21940, partial [Streptomyces sp. NPDC094149]